MRLAVLIADLLHLLVLFACLVPFGGLAFCLAFRVAEPWLVMGLCLVPLVSTAAAAVVLDLHLIEHHPALQQMRVLWSCLLMLLPPVVGPLLWVGWGRRWLRQQTGHPAKGMADSQVSSIPLPIAPMKKTGMEARKQEVLPTPDLPRSEVSASPERGSPPVENSGRKVRGEPALLLTTFEALGPVTPAVSGEEQTIRVVPRPRPVTATFYDERL